MKNQITNVYKQAERFAAITKTAIILGNITRAKKCLSVAESLFVSGTKETQNAITNVYVFSISQFMELRHCSISNFFPPLLKAEYVKQINTSGVRHYLLKITQMWNAHFCQLADNLKMFCQNTIHS